MPRARTRVRSSRRAAVVAVSAAAMGLGCSPAFLLGYLGVELRADLGLSRGELGLLIGVFYGCTGVGSLLAARLSEPLGPRRCVMLDQLVVAVSLLGVVFVPTHAALAVAAAASGLGYALNNAGTSMAVAAVAPAGRRGQDLTVKTAGVPMMATLLALAGPAAGTVVGWPGVALGLAGSALVNAVAAGLILPASPPWRQGRTATAAPGVSARREMPRGFLLLPVGAFLFIGGSQPLLSWLVLSLTDAGFSATAAGRVSAAGTAVGIAAMIGISRLADRAGPSSRALVLAGLAATAVLGVGLLWWAGGGALPLVLLGAVLGLTGNLAGASTVHAVVVDRVPWAVGRAIGLMSTGYFLGALVSPWAFGAAADRTGGYDLSWAICAATLAAGALCFLLAHRRIPLSDGAA